MPIFSFCIPYAAARPSARDDRVSCIQWRKGSTIRNVRTMGGGLANADACVNFACKRPNFADVGVNNGGRPLWMAPHVAPAPPNLAECTIRQQCKRSVVVKKIFWVQKAPGAPETYKGRKKSTRTKKNQQKSGDLLFLETVNIL